MAKSLFRFTTRQIEERKVAAMRAILPPESLTILTQVRQTLEIDDLMTSILSHGQQTPGLAAVLSPKEARAYIAELNEIFGVAHTFEDLVAVTYNGRRMYFVLVAGHRRHETCREINQQVAQGEASFTPAYQGKYRVELRFHLTAHDAIALQFNENRHMQVPPHEEARRAWGYWSWMSRHEKDFSVASFARLIGRSGEWVRNALRFCELPLSVQEYVDGGTGKPKLPYRVLVEVARLAEGYRELVHEDLPEQIYHNWLRRAVLEKLDSTKFGRMVSEFLKDKKDELAGQLSLFGGNGTTTDERPVRRIVGPRMVKDLYALVAYVKIVERLHTAGKLGKGSYLGPEPEPKVRDLYSPGSPLKLLADVSELMERLLPHLISIARAERGRHRKRLAARTPLATPLRDLTRVIALAESLMGPQPTH